MAKRRPTTKRVHGEVGPSGCMLVFVFAFVLGLAGWGAWGWWSERHPPGPGPQPPTPPAPIVEDDHELVAAATHAAAVAYFRRLAPAYRELEKSPPATTTDAADAVKKIDAEAFEEMRKAFNAVIQPRLGADELDPTKAKQVFGAMADGLERVQ